MKKIALAALMFTSGYACAQKLTLQLLKDCKNIPQYDYVEVKNSEIVYPVTGLTDIHMEQVTMIGQGGGGGGLFPVIELWVIDAKGKIVYNTVYTINTKYASNGEAITDADYLKLMKRNEKELRKRRGYRL